VQLEDYVGDRRSDELPMTEMSTSVNGVFSEDRDARTFVHVWLWSAALVTVIRFLHAAQAGHDIGLQIQAAENLLRGNGLSTYQHTGANLTAAPSLVTLTHFPAGYSLCAATLMALGLSVGTMLKVMGAVPTMLGWLGWARLACPFLLTGMTGTKGWRWAGVAVAGLTPVFFTPSWSGTDVILWAVLPWVLLCLVRAADDEQSRAGWRDALAGALCGLALLMRYASLFLACYGAGVILWQSRLRLFTVARRWGLFAAGIFPAVSLQLVVNYVISNTPAKPGGLAFETSLAIVARRLWEGVHLLHTANYPYAFWFPGKLLSVLFPDAVNRLPWQLGVFLIALMLLFQASQIYRCNSGDPSRDLRLVSLGLFPALPLFLLACMALGIYDYVGDQRYYWPLVPLGLLVAYSVAAEERVTNRRATSMIVRTFASLYLGSYLAMSLVYAGFLFAPGRVGNSQRQKLLASQPSVWPSFSVMHEYLPSRQFAMDLMRDDREARLLTVRPMAFFWDPAFDQSKLYELSCEGLKATHLTGPARFIIITFDEGGPEELWYYMGNGITGGIFRADCFKALPEVRVLRHFPTEGLKVLEARVLATEDVSLITQGPARPIALNKSGANQR
jgi:hypothetical protein